VKFLIIQFFEPPVTSISLGPDIIVSTLVLKHPRFILPNSHPYKRTGNILSCVFLDVRREDRTF